MPLLREAGWKLESATDADISEIMGWFPDADAVLIWGGPGFRFPFTAATFREDCRLDSVESYSLFDPQGDLVAFGQSYERYGRGHLARIVSHPARRRTGAGRRLVSMIIAVLAGQQDFDEYSLFVFRHNEPAYRCYLSLGFVVREYPDDVALRDKCYFLTKRRRKE